MSEAKLPDAKRISEATALPISLVIVLLGVAAWVSSLKSDTKTNADDIARVEAQEEQYIKVIQRINERLSRIEGKLGIQPPLEGPP
jgi:hypothetical protein